MTERTCLLVMGDTADAVALARALRGVDLDPLRAPDAISAISQARAQVPDVVLVGSRLPGGSNGEVIERLQALIHTAHIPIIAVVEAEASADDAQRLLDRGASRILRRPLDVVAWADAIAAEASGGVFRNAPASIIQDPERLSAVRNTGLLDGGPNDQLDRFTRLARRLLRAPSSVVSLVDADRQYFAGHTGLRPDLAEAHETPLTHSFCQWAVATREPLAVDDARTHPLFHDSPAVEEYDVGSYCGVPIMTKDGHALGTLCVIDSEPRRWDEDDIAALTDLAGVLSDYVSLTRPELSSRPG